MSSASYKVEDVVGFANTVISSRPTYIIGPDKVDGYWPNENDNGSLFGPLSPGPFIFAQPRIAGQLYSDSVSIGSNKVVVGAPNNNNSGVTAAGAAFIYDTDFQFAQANNAFSNQITLSPTTGQGGLVVNANANFGKSVAVRCGRVVVGAPRQDFRSFFSSPIFAQLGRVYIYDLNGTQINAIVPPSAGFNGSQALFGWSVAVGEEIIVVGEPQGQISGNVRGRAHIYDLNGNFIKTLIAFDSVNNAEYGYSVSVGCGRIVVGSPSDNTEGTGNGSFYIYDLAGNLIRKVIPTEGVTNGNGKLGFSVSVDSGLIFAGAPLMTINGVSQGGQVLVFDINGYNLLVYDVRSEANIGGTPIPNLFNISAGDQFGYSVVVKNGTFLIGQPFYDFTSNGAPQQNNGKITFGKLNRSVSGNTLTLFYIDFWGPNAALVNSNFGKSAALGSGKVIYGNPGTFSNEGIALYRRVDDDSDVYWENILETYKY